MDDVSLAPFPEQSPQMRDATSVIDDVRALKAEFGRFLQQYQFGLDEITTKMEILREEFRTQHQYNPIEHLGGRLKSPESLLDKIQRTDCPPDFASIRERITDIAGVRIVCAFVSDVHRMFELITAQQDITLLTVKDYVTHPKPNGYRSLHAIVEVPVYLSTGRVAVPVEIQLRTAAMDFWASLEHKIYYKYDGAVPGDLRGSLRQTAITAAQLDQEMEELHTRVHGDPAMRERIDLLGGEGGGAIAEPVIARLMAQQAARGEIPGC